MAANPALARHVIDRLGYGPRADDIDRIEAMGVDRWVEQQLNPQSIPLSPAYNAKLANFPTLGLSPLQIFMTYGPPSVRNFPGEKLTPELQQQRNRRMQFVANQAVRVRLLRAIESPRQLEECLGEFWFNHFNVFLGKGLDRLWLGAYVEEAIRPHILGRFRDLLGATAKHPAMLFFLDNWLNTTPDSPGAKGQFEGINENYARELMELHTLGVSGGYTQDDVIALAKILTGWTIGPVAQRPERQPRPMFMAMPMFRPAPMRLPRIEGRGIFVFDADCHDFSDKVLLGRTIKGRGVEEGEEALDMLARSPATARHVSYQLAQYFLADAPDNAVVDAMTKSFLASDGDIKTVLRTLLFSAAFRAPANFGMKFKTPYRYVVSAVRAAGIEVTNFRPLEGMLNQLGERPYGCLTPDGYKQTEEAWLNSDAMMRRISFAVALARGAMPLEAPPPDELAAPVPAAATPGPMQAQPPAAQAAPLDAGALRQSLGDLLSPATLAAIDAAPPQLHAALILGSPDFMRC